MQKISLFRPGVLLLPLVLVACGGGGGGGGDGVVDGGGGSTVTTGELTLGVTDAAVDSATSVLVQFTGVAVKPMEGNAIELPLSGDSQTCQDLLDGVAPAPTVEGATTVRCVDLLTLQGTASATLLDGVTLDAGEYNWLRLDVDAERGVMDSLIVLDDGAVESLYVPSGSQSGLKLNTGFTILPGGEHDFVIDFDLRKSVNNPHGFPDYQLRPSLRLTDRMQSGNITGTVDASLLTAGNCTQDAYAVYVYAGGEGAAIGDEGSANPPLTSASVTLDGNEWRYTVGYLAPGEYTLAFTCEAANDSVDADDGIAFIGSADSPVTVRSRGSSTVNFIPGGPPAGS